MTEDELEGAVEVFELIKARLVELELVVVLGGVRSRGGRGRLFDPDRVIDQPVGRLVQALTGLTRLERAVLRGAKAMTVLSVYELQAYVRPAI